MRYGEDGSPVDVHLDSQSPLVDAGDPAVLDPDHSRSDIGMYGGVGADLWDLDNDGAFDYFWPGGFSEAPDGVDTSSFDCDDLDPMVQSCL